MQGQRFLRKLQTLAARLKNTRVIFPGYVTGDRKRGLFALADLYVFPSRHESYGLTATRSAGGRAPSGVSRPLRRSVRDAGGIRRSGSGIGIARRDHAIAGRRNGASAHGRRRTSVRTRRALFRPGGRTGGNYLGGELKFNDCREPVPPSTITPVFLSPILVVHIFRDIKIAFRIHCDGRRISQPSSAHLTTEALNRPSDRPNHLCSRVDVSNPVVPCINDVKVTPTIK